MNTDVYKRQLCPENFMDGWMVNHTLTQTGIPSIRRMSEEEYRTSRNMSVDPVSYTHLG